MRRAMKVFSIGAAVLLVAWAAPTQVNAACATLTTEASAQCGFTVACGLWDVGAAPNNVGGDFVFMGAGLDVVGTGAGGDGGVAGHDAGLKAARVMPLYTFAEPYEDLLGAGAALPPDTTRLFFWDFGGFGTDGCVGAPSVLLAVVTNTDKNEAAIGSIAPGPPSPAAGSTTYDWDTITNGAPDPFFGAPVAMPLTRAVTVVGSGDIAGPTVSVSVAGFAAVTYDDVGGTRPIFASGGGPFAVDLVTKPNTISNAPGVVVNAGPGPATVVVTETDLLCWEATDGAYTLELGCVEIGVPNAAQEVLNPTYLRRGKTATFKWSIVQSTVAGFNIYKEDVTRGTKRQLNTGLIYAGDNTFSLQDYVQNFDVRGRGSRYTLEMITIDGDSTWTTFTPAGKTRKPRGRR